MATEIIIEWHSYCVLSSLNRLHFKKNSENPNDWRGAIKQWTKSTVDNIKIQHKVWYSFRHCSVPITAFTADVEAVYLTFSCLLFASSTQL